MRCDNCGAKATRRFVAGWVGPINSADPDIDYAFYCDDCAGEDGGEPMESEGGDEPTHESLDSLHQRAWEMDRNPLDPRW